MWGARVNPVHSLKLQLCEFSSNKPRQTDHKKNCRFRDRFFSIHFISTMVCFMMVKRMMYTSHPRKAAKQPLRKVVASVVVNAYTQ